MKSYTKSVVLILGTCLLASACAKKKSTRPVARTTPGSVNQSPVGQVPGLDDGEQARTQSGATPVETVAPAPSMSRSELAPLQQFEGREGQIQTQDGPVANYEEPKTGGNNNELCGTAYRANNEMWFPGLPNTPSATVVCTGHGGGKDFNREKANSCQVDSGYLYTDARQDDLLRQVSVDFNKLPPYLNVASRQFSRRILNVEVESRLFQVGSINLRVTLFAGFDNGRIRKNVIHLRGNMRETGGVKLHAVNKDGRIANYEGQLMCMDESGDCENSILRLDQIVQPHDEEVQASPVVKKGKKVKNASLKQRAKRRKAGVGAVAYVVLRNGEAHVTMSDQERLGFKSIPNQAQSFFAQFMSNTVNNSCLNLLKDVKQGRKKLDPCAYNRLIQQCGRSQYKDPSASDFALNTWSVIYGRSGFEFTVTDTAGRQRLQVRGPLVVTNAKPMWSRALHKQGELAQHIENAFLIANDGGGNLNLQFDFAGAEKSQSRISLTMMSNNVRMGAETRQAIEESKLADPRDVEQTAQGEVPADEEGGSVEAQVAPPLPQPVVVEPAAPAAQPQAPVAPAPQANVAPQADAIPQADEAEQSAPIPGTDIAPPTGIPSAD